MDNKENPVNMDEVGEVLIGALDSVLSNYDADDAVKLTDFIDEFSGRWKIKRFSNKDSLAELSKRTMEDDLCGGFLMEMTYQFVARWGRDEAGLMELARIITLGVIHPYSGAEDSMLPASLGERMLDQSDFLRILKENRWLLVMLLIRVFYTNDPEAAPVAEKS